MAIMVYGYSVVCGLLRKRYPEGSKNYIELCTVGSGTRAVY